MNLPQIVYEDYSGVAAGDVVGEYVDDLANGAATQGGVAQAKSLYIYIVYKVLIAIQNKLLVNIFTCGEADRS